MSFNSKYTGAQVEAWLDNIKNYSANDILEKLKTVDGSNSGLDADMLDGYHVSNVSKPFGGIPTIGSTGYMDIGSNLDFHYDNTTGSDYSVRLKCTGNHVVTVSLPSSGGTLALTSDNVASATKLQDDTAYTAWGQTFFANGKPQSLSGQLSNVGHINFVADGANDVGSNTYSARYMYAKWVGAKSGNTFSIGANNGTHMYINTQGNVTIGSSDLAATNYKLYVNGNIHTSGTLTQDSDIRLKNINKDILLSIEDIANAPLFEFTYKSDEDKRIHAGTSAQYWVEKNNWFCKKQDNGYYDMEIQNLALASAISIAKEFKKYKEETESTIDNMKREIEELKQIVLNMNK